MPRKRAKSEPDELTKRVLCRLSHILGKLELERFKRDAGLTDEIIQRLEADAAEIAAELRRQYEANPRLLDEHLANQRATWPEEYLASLGSNRAPLTFPAPPAPPASSL